jgi:hypothetical protein
MKVKHSRKLVTEMTLFAREHRVFWLIPLALTLALAMLLIVGSQTAAPFMYFLW